MKFNPEYYRKIKARTEIATESFITACQAATQSVRALSDAIGSIDRQTQERLKGDDADRQP